VTNDEAIRQKEREGYLKELEAELKDLKEANVGCEATGLLRHVYKTYPPKNPEHKLNDEGLDDRAKMKKALLTAIHHYHPDKQDTEQYGRKWAVLCEEITKLLNGRYECHKFPQNETETTTETETESKTETETQTEADNEYETETETECEDDDECEDEDDEEDLFDEEDLEDEDDEAENETGTKTETPYEAENKDENENQYKDEDENENETE